MASIRQKVQTAVQLLKQADTVQKHVTIRNQEFSTFWNVNSPESIQVYYTLKKRWICFEHLGSGVGAEIRI